MNRIIRHIIPILLTGILCVCLSACGRGSYDKGELDKTGIFRADKLMFDTPVAQLQQALTNCGYKGHMLNIRPQDPAYMQTLAGYVQDTVIRATYDLVKKDYDDLSWLEKDLKTALDKAHKLDEDVNIKNVSAFVPGMYDYQNRICCDGDELLICLDVYVLPELKKYSYLGNPMYLVKLCKKEYMLPDCISAVAKSLVRMPQKQPMTLLDAMIMEGKAMYMTNHVLPNVADTLKTRYSQQQQSWIEGNEGKVWAYIMQNQLLFETSEFEYQNLIGEGPSTNAFGSESAPRCACYIGWKIVESYMDNKRCSLKELMENTDSQQILRDSKYKPR